VIVVLPDELCINDIYLMVLLFFEIRDIDLYCLLGGETKNTCVCNNIMNNIKLTNLSSSISVMNDFLEIFSKSS
jgi:hypothetical protein